MFEIKAKSRILGTKRQALESEGEIPAVYYGAGSEATAIAIPLIEFKKVWLKAGESSAVKLTVDGKAVDTLIHEVGLDPVTNQPIHVDFLVIDMKKKIQVSVPLEFVGISNAVKSGLGNLVKVLHEIEIEALPADLPHSIDVDLTKLATVDDVILVSDLRLPSGVVAMTHPTEVVASIVLQKEEKLEDSVPVDLSQIEVEKKGKKEEEGEVTEEK